MFISCCKGGEVLPTLLVSQHWVWINVPGKLLKGTFQEISEDWEWSWRYADQVVILSESNDKMLYRSRVSELV